MKFCDISKVWHHGLLFELRNIDISCKLFYDFIYLTQVHTFTVNAQDIFTFGRIPLFSLSFTGI